MSENDKQPKSVIVIKFAAPGSAEFNIQVQHAMPAQLLAAAEFLRLMAARQINDGWTQDAVQRAAQDHAVNQVQDMLRGTD